MLTLTPGRTNRLGFSIFGTMAPNSEDFVAVEGPDNTSVPPRLLLALRHPPQAISVLESARDELLEILTHAGWEPRVAVYHLEAPGNSVHYGGTCRMHVSPRFGVVDANCRVHGIRNLMVADSSVFTTGPEKNPVLTAMTLAARGSKLLADDLRSGDA